MRNDNSKQLFHWEGTSVESSFVTANSQRKKTIRKGTCRYLIPRSGARHTRGRLTKWLYIGVYDEHTRRTALVQ
jgi:hypothetical protein